jgi:hypothetical protein
MQHNDEPYRREMGCGWMPPSESTMLLWTGPKRSLEGQVTVCPGYTTRLPDVVDVARLLWWIEHGTVQRDALAPVVVTGIDVLRSSIAECEQFRFDEIKEGNRGPR